jgi:hypothetical protein
VGGVSSYPICQPAGGDFFLNNTFAWLHCWVSWGAGDVERLWMCFCNSQPGRRNFFLNWATPSIEHGVREVRGQVRDVEEVRNLKRLASTGGASRAGGRLEGCEGSG